MSFPDLIGESPSMKALSSFVDRVARVTANVLISGESGTGKEMVARSIHSRGPRSDRPLVAVNCAAIPEGLLESELFGHAKGAFTGAHQRRPGLFEVADGGTLFLDEIGDMSVVLQTKILRVIQERQVRAVGDNAPVPVDVRIIAATHRDLKAEIERGRFREDLYYRLNVVPIAIPPLRQRKDDIPILALHFLKKYAAKNGVSKTGFTRKAIDVLLEMQWRGNVRELENFVERAVVMSSRAVLGEEDLPRSEEGLDPEKFFHYSTDDFPTLERLERRYLSLVLRKTNGRKDKAAQILGINRRTLYRKARDYGIASDGAPRQLPLFGGIENSGRENSPERPRAPEI